MLKRYGKKYPEMFEYATSVVAVSHDMADRLVSFGCPREKIVYNPSAPNDAYYQVRPTFGKKLFIGAGRFVHKKAPQNTILAFVKVLEKHPDAQLILAGNGKLFKHCKKLVKQHNLENFVYLPGAFNSEQLKQWFSEATAFVQHSMTAPNGDMEGTPNSITEASLAGLPVISTFHAGIPNVIIDGKTGLLVNEGDIDAMAEKMIWILDHPQEAQKMGHAGKENIWENFNLKKCVGILDEIISAAAVK
jgi:glycosyltransferase involved in cell wall biosynthesis